MAFATATGVTVPIVRDSWNEAPEWIGSVSQRGMNGAHFETRAGRKRSWTAAVAIQEAADAEAMRMLLEGQCQAFPFDADAYSSKGVAPKAGGTYTQSATGGKHTGKLNVGSASHVEYALANRLGIPDGWDPTKGWTLMCWKKLTVGDGGDGATYFHHIATGSVALTRGASANPSGVTQYQNGVAGNYAMGNWIDVASDGDVMLTGYTNVGTATAYDYDDLVLYPFELPSTWAAGLYTFLNVGPHPGKGRVHVAGDCVQDPAAVPVVIRASKVNYSSMVLGGAHRNNARMLDITVHEV